MTTIHTLHLISDLAAKAFAFGGELFSAATLAVLLNALASMINKTYAAGKICGAFYFAHLHAWVVKAIAFYILGCVLTFQGLRIACRWIYQHRAEIYTPLGVISQQIIKSVKARDLGVLFAYQSPVFAGL
jgi:hypothetical protein